MDFNSRRLVPYIPPAEYDKVATEFLEKYYPQSLINPMPVPIEEIAINEMGLNVQYVCLSEEQDIYGMTIFTDGVVEIYNSLERLYDTQVFKSKTILIDPEVVKKTNSGCKNNTIAHECVHWYKHRLFYKRQQFSLSQYAKVCKCKISQSLETIDEDNIMESQATGIAPRILMPKNTFIEAVEQLGVSYGRDNRDAIRALAELYDVSRRSVEIRLEECNLL